MAGFGSALVQRGRAAIRPCGSWTGRGLVGGVSQMGMVITLKALKGRVLIGGYLMCFPA